MFGPRKVVLMITTLKAACVVLGMMVGTTSAQTLDVQITSMTNTVFQAELVEPTSVFPVGTILEGSILRGDGFGDLCVELVRAEKFDMAPQPNECHAIGHVPLNDLPDGSFELVSFDVSRVFKLTIQSPYQRDFGFLGKGDCIISSQNGNTEIVSRHRLSNMLNGWGQPPLPRNSQIECPQ